MQLHMNDMKMCIICLPFTQKISNLEKQLPPYKLRSIIFTESIGCSQVVMNTGLLWQTVHTVAGRLHEDIAEFLFSVKTI